MNYDPDYGPYTGHPMDPRTPPPDPEWEAIELAIYDAVSGLEDTQGDMDRGVLSKAAARRILRGIAQRLTEAVKC
jgi:hypothetical protein